MSRLRVLLFSPLPGRDPESGDLAYTEALLDDPPSGVEFVTYADAIDRGWVEVAGRRDSLRRGSAVDLRVFGLRSLESSLRRAGVMFREPNWYIRIQAGCFDLLHQHLFQVAQLGAVRLPVVSSAGYPLSELYRERDRWNTARVKVATALERAAATVGRVHNPWIHFNEGSVSTFYTGHFRDFAVGRGCDPSASAVLGTALPAMAGGTRRSDRRTLVFVGRDFLRKGGDVAVEALSLVRREIPDARLLVVTRDGPDVQSLSNIPGIEVLAGLSREQVRQDVLPQSDVMLLPTRSDCGAPYAVLEALQQGVPVVVSNYPWLDSRLEAPGAARCEIDPIAIAKVVVGLIGDRASWERASHAAERLWKNHFDTTMFRVALREVYDRALASAH